MTMITIIDRDTIIIYNKWYMMNTSCEVINDDDYIA